MQSVAIWQFVIVISIHHLQNYFEELFEIQTSMADGRSLRECLLESVDDLDAVVKQVTFYCCYSVGNSLLQLLNR